MRNGDRVKLLAALIVAACSSAPITPAKPSACALPESTVLLRDGNAVLERWDLPADGPWLEPVLPTDASYAAYRAAIRDAGAELARPIADEPVANSDDEREIWRRERINADVAAPYVRPIRCLEAALFARQHARYDQLSHPTELTSVILRKDRVLRVYAGASDQMFPPKTVYGLTEARRDHAGGWRVIAQLHNHTIQKRAGRHALGSPAPSTADVHLLRNVAPELALERILVTNGVFTADIPTTELARFQAR
jgi:hypothetical protein